MQLSEVRVSDQEIGTLKICSVVCGRSQSDRCTFACLPAHRSFLAIIYKLSRNMPSPAYDASSYSKVVARFWLEKPERERFQMYNSMLAIG